MVCFSCNESICYFSLFLESLNYDVGTLGLLPTPIVTVTKIGAHYIEEL